MPRVEAATGRPPDSETMSERVHTRSDGSWYQITAIDEPSATEIGTEVVLAVAATIDTDPEALPPLTESVDPDALVAFFTSPDGGPHHDNRHITFTYAGHRVRITKDGLLIVDPIDASD